MADNKYMKAIGENLNVINKKIGAAFKEKDPAPIREMAEKVAEAEVDYVDINLGPARKGGEELMTLGSWKRFRKSPTFRCALTRRTSTLWPPV
jgi:hypothetical protein